MPELKGEYFDLIIKYVNKLCPNIRKPKYSNKYYLENILNLLTDFVSWRSLKKSLTYKFGELINKTKEEQKKDNHYKTICAKHVEWARKNVYMSAYTEILGRKITENEKKDTLQLIIDATNIINKSGIEGVGYGTKCKKKKFTKLTGLSDTKANMVTIIENKTKEKEIEFENGKKIKIQTLEHDIKGILPAIASLNTNKKIELLGDKGYIVNSEHRKELEKIGATIITPYKSNQKKVNTEDEKKKLKIRYKIENSFAKLKCPNRLHVKRDKYMKNFMGFVYLGYLCIS